MSDAADAPFNGETISLDQSGDRVCVVLQPDSNIVMKYELFYKDVSAEVWSQVVTNDKVSNNKRRAISLNFSASDLKGDGLKWEVACAAANSGTWPVLVQVFQSKKGTFQPISRVARYDMDFTSQEPLQGFYDEIRFA